MIHVLIERTIAEDMVSTYEENAKYALHQTYSVSGFISGEAFTDVNAPNRRLLLCKWRSRRDWQRWRDSEERKDLMNMVAPVLEEPEKITVMENSVIQTIARSAGNL